MKIHKKHLTGLIIGSLLTLSLPISYCGYWIGINRAFATLAAPGKGDAQALSSNIDVILHSLVSGCIGSLVGIVIVVWSLIAHRRATRRAREMTSQRTNN